MLEKFSVSLILLVVASLVGINSIYQPTDVVTQPDILEPTAKVIRGSGTVWAVHVYASSDGKACAAAIVIDKWYFLLASDESICDLFGKAKEGEREL